MVIWDEKIEKNDEQKLIMMMEEGISSDILLYIVIDEPFQNNKVHATNFTIHNIVSIF